MPQIELFANNFTTTLAAPVLAGDTTIAVVATPPSSLQNVGVFRIVIDSEIMLVTASVGMGTAWPVTRGSATGEQPVPVAVGHAFGSTVSQVLTQAGLLNSESNLPASAVNASSAVPGTSPVAGGAGAYSWGAPVTSNALATFPAAGMLDNFNRANGALGASWGQVDPAYPLPLISGNQAVGAGQNSGYWTTVLGADQEVRTKVASFADTTNLMLRLLNLPSSSETGYEARFGATSVTVNLVQAPTRTALLTVNRITPSAPWIGFRVVGDLLSVWESSDGLTWTLLGSVSNSYFRRDGYVGYFSNSSATLSMFGGGQVNADATGGSYRWDGVSDGVAIGLGNATITDLFSLVVVAKVRSGVHGALLNQLTTDNHNLFFEGSGTLQTYDGATQCGALATSPIVGRWAVYAVTRASGASVTPQFYAIDLITGAVNTSAGAVATAQGTAANGFTVGYSSAFAGHRLDGDVACAAIWKSALTKTQLAGITSYAALAALTPVWSVRFNGTAPFSDSVAAAAQISLLGGSHSTDLCPGF